MPRLSYVLDNLKKPSQLLHQVIHTAYHSRAANYMVASLTSPIYKTATSIDLITVAMAFHNDPQQIKLMHWLQSSTGEQKQAEFALMWRDGQPGGAIDFAQAFLSYKGLPHQNAALQWLQKNTQAQTLEGFAKMWQDWNLNSTKKQDLRLNVPYFQQVDNKFEPMRTCNTSSCAMVARFMGAKIASDDEYYQIVIKYGDTTDHNAQTKALTQLGIKSVWHTDLGFDDLDQSLAAGLPCVIGILHRGSLASPTGGHMIVVIGKTASQDYICHDPYGSLLDAGGGYTGDVNHGKAVVYPRYVLTRRWLPDGEKAGWGRLFMR